MTERFRQEIESSLASMFEERMAIEPVTFPVPPSLLAGLERYRDLRVPTGDFLRCVLENNLKGAVGAADPHSQLALCAIVSWCYNKLPSAAWGSPERVAAWLAE